MNNISLWYKFAMKQFAAESYIDRMERWTNTDTLTEDLMRGNTNWVPGAATDKLYTKMSESQAREFVADNQIIAHQANTASGFSATLTKENVGGIDEYTLSFRSTEYKVQSVGGDKERDAFGADLEINNDGFAFAQIADMEAYYVQLKASGALPNGAVLNVTGYSLNDIIVGGKGNDTLSGGIGNDTYVFARGDGSDTIKENDATVGNADAIQFLAGITSDQIWLRHVGNNLEVSVIGTGDKLVIKDWYLGDSYHVEQFKTADSKILTDDDVENLVQAMSPFVPPAMGEIVLLGTYHDTLASVIDANWW